MIVTRSSHDTIRRKFELFEGGTGGLDNWLGPNSSHEIFDVLAEIETNPLSRAQLNQLLTLAHEAPVSDGFFTYYWLSVPSEHPYPVRNIPCFDKRWAELDHINSLDQLYWGLYRFYVDALLYFGNIRTAFQRLRSFSKRELVDCFRQHLIDTASLSQRGDPIGLVPIARDHRYLISEMACKSLENGESRGGELVTVLTRLYKRHVASGGGPVTSKELLSRAYEEDQFSAIQLQLNLASDDFSDENIANEAELLMKIERVESAYKEARAVALENTRTYLSMVGDLDVYVATSMRVRRDFRDMADFCEGLFSDPVLAEFILRYFDPTLSAAAHHEDKGLIECLMVKCAKVLVLHAGAGDSYGKDAEAAMALSLGKPVVIYADKEFRSSFFKDIHPLSRLINFETGVAIGAMVATSPSQVAQIIYHILSNTVEYELSQLHPKYLVLKEKITGSVVRLQTSDDLLRETFWNHYHNDVR